MAVVIKVFGMCLMMACTVSIGLSMAYALKKRVEELETALAVVTALENEITCTLSPPDQAVFRLESRESLEAAAFLPACASLCRQGFPFPQAWRNAVKDQKGALSDEDVDILSSLADTLGQYELDSQRSQLYAARAHLKLQLDSAREKCSGYARLYRTMGVLTGAFLIVVFI